MKTNLLKMALAALALFPIGAWAESDRTTYSTEGETVISETNTWVLNSHTAGEIKTITSPLSDGLYVRANNSNTWTIESAVGSATFSDGTTVSYTQIASSSGANSNQGSNVYSAGYTGAGRFYCTLAINTSVAGTCYAIMSGTSGKNGRVQFTEGTALKSEEGAFAGDGNLIEVKYTSTGAGTFFIGGKNGETDCKVKVYAVRFVPTEQTVSAATSLTFDHFAKDANLNSVYNMANGFFIRGNSQKYFTVQDNTDASKPYSFSGGESLQANKYVELNGAISANAFSNDNDKDPWTTTGSTTYPSIAFKNTVAGKILVYAAKASESTATLRYYKKSATTTSTNLSVTTTPTEYSWDVAADEVTYITAGTAAGLRIYGVRFVPKTYTLTVNAENGTVTRSPEKDAYDYNEVVTLTATPNDGYKFVNWSTGETTASINVTMTEDKTITANFAKAVATTVWKFEQYMSNAGILVGESNTASAAEYTDGLYFHTRSLNNTSHQVIAATGRVTDNNLSTHFGTYKKNEYYMAAKLGSGGGTVPTASHGAGECKTIDGVSFKAPVAGHFYATVVRSSTDNHKVYIYKNGEKADEVTLGNTTQGKEFDVTVAANDVIYLFTQTEANGKAAYLFNAGFVPTTADAVTKIVTLKGAGDGYATFSATQNYNLPEDVSGYIVSNVNEDTKTVTLREVNEIPACTGVILYKEGVSSDTEITLTSKETTTADVSSNMLKANIADYALPASAIVSSTTYYNYILTADGFKRSSGSGTLAANKAFLRTTIGSSASAPVLSFDFGSGTTGIEKVAMEQQADGVYYNMAGQRVAQPTKGLYIVNGKKVIIK